jgi:hypothetical protein
MVRINPLVSMVLVVGFGCSTSADDIPATRETAGATRSAVPEGEILAANALSSELHDVLVARWEGFKRAALSRPDNDVLAVELTRTLDGATAVTFTVAQSGSPVRYVVVGDENGNVNANEYEHPAAATVRGLGQTETFTVSDGGAIDPSVIALGIPPPQQPGTPGVIATGAALLTEVFAPTGDAGDVSLGVERIERALRAVPAASPRAGTVGACEPIDKSTADSTALRDVLIARWNGFQRLATTQPNHHVLAVELVRALDGETIAAFTIVVNGQPVRYVVAGDARGQVTAPSARCASFGRPEAVQLAIEAPAAADPAAVAIAEPPPHQPGTPGVIAVGGQLLSAAFGGMGIVRIAAEQ